MDLEAWRHGGVVLIVTGRGIRVGDGRRHALPSPTRIRTKTKLHGRGRGASRGFYIYTIITVALYTNITLIMRLTDVTAFSWISYIFTTLSYVA
jgi:hypothetical protein